MSAVDYHIGWPLFAFGVALIAGGAFGLAWIFRHWWWDEPEIPAVVELQPPPVDPNYTRPDSDTCVIPRIPPYLPEIGPKPASKRNHRRLSAVADVLYGSKPDCPLTTQEIEIAAESTPAYDATVERADTRDLTAQILAVRAET